MTNTYPGNPAAALGERLRTGTCCTPGACDPGLVKRGMAQDEVLRERLDREGLLTRHGAFKNHKDTDEPFFYRRAWTRRGGRCLVPEHRPLICRSFFCEVWRERMDAEDIAYAELARSAVRYATLQEILEYLTLEFAQGPSLANPAGYLLFVEPEQFTATVDALRKLLKTLADRTRADSKEVVCNSDTDTMADGNGDGGNVAYGQGGSREMSYGDATYVQLYKGVTLVLDHDGGFCDDVASYIASIGSHRSGSGKCPVTITTRPLNALFSGQSGDALWRNATMFHGVVSFLVHQ